MVQVHVIDVLVDLKTKKNKTKQKEVKRRKVYVYCFYKTKSVKLTMLYAPQERHSSSGSTLFAAFKDC